MRYAIDIGHNVIHDGGAVGILNENITNMEVGTRVISKLRQLGHEVIETLPKTATSTGHSLRQRCDTANNAKADIFVSIHFNAFNGQARGTEIYCASAKGEEIAKKVLPELVKLGYTNRGVKRANYQVLINTNMPAILVECCFIDNIEDVKFYDAEKFATAIVKGLTGQVVEEPKEKTYTKAELMELLNKIL